jgi:hypothetical protein
MRRERLTMILSTLVGAAALFGFGRHTWKSRVDETEDHSMTLRCEVLTIYTSKAFVEFAKAHPDITTNAELVRLLGESKIDGWFATVSRLHQANGAVTYLALSYRLGDRLECFNETKVVVRALARDCLGPDAADCENAQIEVVEDAMMGMEPVQGLRQLLSR